MEQAGRGDGRTAVDPDGDTIRKQGEKMTRICNGTVIVTYRCNAHCNMCDCFKYPTKPEEEITLDVVGKAA